MQEEMKKSVYMCGCACVCILVGGYIDYLQF